jgi:hypothetical protein
MPDTASLSLILDALLAVLLAAALAYMWRVNGRLAQIRAGKAEFEKMIGEFAQTTGQAASTLEQFKTSAGSAGRDLAASTGRAVQLASGQERTAADLRMLLERGEALADRMESLIFRARTVAGTMDFATATPAAPVPKDPALVEPVLERKPHPVLKGIAGLR